MGWSRGSEIMNVIIDSSQKYIPEENRKLFYKDVILSFTDNDWDTENECVGKDPQFDEALREVYDERGWDSEWIDEYL